MGRPSVERGGRITNGSSMSAAPNATPGNPKELQFPATRKAMSTNVACIFTSTPRTVAIRYDHPTSPLTATLREPAQSNSSVQNDRRRRGYRSSSSSKSRRSSDRCGGAASRWRSLSSPRGPTTRPGTGDTHRSQSPAVRGLERFLAHRALHVRHDPSRTARNSTKPWRDSQLASYARHASYFSM